MTRTVALAYSANDIASALDMHTPTDEQRAVIEAPLAPLLVVAGAGSGKTETMASRVVWLVANGLVEPDQVLGLTFTRKAATELAERITQRLRRLQRAGLWTPPEDDDDAETLGGTPTVSTYHSYAGRLVREHALRLGYESESRLLSEAAAWQYAAEVVARYDGPMDAVAKAESTITAAVVDLAGEMAEHLLTPVEVRRLPRSGSTRRWPPCPGAPAGPRTSRPRPARCATPCGSEPPSCRWSSATSRSSASATPWTSLTRWRSLHGSRRASTTSAASSASGSARCCSTSSRTPPRPSSSCSGRCSWRRASRCR